MGSASLWRRSILSSTRQKWSTQKNFGKAQAHSPLLSVLYFQNKAVRCSRRGGHCDLPKSGHKADPAQVAKDMRHARHEDGNRGFTVDEFLTPQQIKSYFSRAAEKLRRRGREDDCDFQAIEEQEAYSSTCAHVIDECQLIHPITYDTFNLCDMYATRKLTRLSISMLRLICRHFDMDIDNLSLPGKAPYIELIGNLVKTCVIVHLPPPLPPQNQQLMTYFAAARLRTDM